MTIIAASSDYTDRDLASLNARLQSLIKSVFPTWTVSQVANFGNILREMFCFVGDVLGFYQDNQAGESRILTATQLKSMIGLAKLLNYLPRSPRAAQTDLTITLDAPVPAGRTVTFTPPWLGSPNPVTVSTEDTADPVEFELQASIIITAGNTTGTGGVKNSKHVGNPSDLTHEPGEYFTSTGLPNQSYQLPLGPYLDGSAVVVDGVGSWAQAENNSLVTAGATDRVYRIEIDENGLATLIFGNGVCGSIPTGTVRIAYETGGGEAGNLTPNSLTKLSGQFVDNTGATVHVLSLTHAAPSDGLERESLESIRQNAPISIQTLSRTVTKEDFENQARLAGMERALLLTQTENRAMAANTGLLYCVPMGLRGMGGTMSAGQMMDVLANFTQKPSSAHPFAKPCMVGFEVSLFTATYVDIGLQVRAYLRKSAAPTTAAAQAIASRMVAAVQKRFRLLKDDGTQNELVDFGFNLGEDSPRGTAEIAMSELMDIVGSVAGVREIGDASDDFRLVAYRAIHNTDGYDSGDHPAALVQALSHSDVPLRSMDFPRLKMLTWGSSIPHVVVLDGDNGDTQLYPL